MPLNCRLECVSMPWGGAAPSSEALRRSGANLCQIWHEAGARRRVAWLGTTASAISRFPVEAKLKLGTALRIAQEGGLHALAKPMKGPLREVTEVVAPCDDGTYRLMYTARLGEVIYVLHAFQKKAHHGIATPQRDLKLVFDRLQLAKTLAYKR